MAEPTIRTGCRRALGLAATLGVVLLACTGLRAQDLPSGEVDVVKDFNARLIQTNKFDLQPELPPLDTTDRQLEFSVQEIPLSIAYPAPQIRPLAVQRADNPDVYRGFARVGGGIPNQLFGEGQYAFFNEENFVLDLNARHHSADNSKQLENQKFSHTQASLDGTYYLESGPALSGRLGFQRQGLHYYGYNARGAELGDSLSFDAEDVRQRFTTFSVGAGLFNGQENDLGLEYSATVDFYHLTDLYSARENGLDLQVRGAKNFNGGHTLDLRIRADLTSFRDTVSKPLNNYFFNPAYTYRGGVFRIRAGVNIASHEGDFIFFPDVNASLNIVPKVLTLFAGVEGTLQKNHLRAMSNYNPYIDTRFDPKNTRFTNYYAGVRGQLLGMDYAARAGFKNARNLALFQSNLDTVPRFQVLYDTVEIITIQGELTMPLFEGFNLTGSIAQNIYTPRQEEKAWHLPGFQLNVGANYVFLEQRLTLRGDLYIENGVPYRTPEGDTGNLNALFDISFGAEYLFTPNIGAFVQLNNVLNNERERWHRYPILGFNVLAGLTARF